MRVSLSLKLLAVTWHTQAPLSYSKLAWRIRKLQSPLDVSPAHSYLPGKAAMGVLSLSQRHSPFLFLTRHVITTSPWGFTSLYPGSSSHCCLASTNVKPITINRATFNWKHIFDIFLLVHQLFGSMFGLENLWVSLWPKNKLTDRFTRQPFCLHFFQKVKFIVKFNYFEGHIG